MYQTRCARLRVVPFILVVPARLSELATARHQSCQGLKVGTKLRASTRDRRTHRRAHCSAAVHGNGTVRCQVNLVMRERSRGWAGLNINAKREHATVTTTSYCMIAGRYRPRELAPEDSRLEPALFITIASRYASKPLAGIYSPKSQPCPSGTGGAQSTNQSRSVFNSSVLNCPASWYGM